MDGYCVESESLKEVRKLINKGEWKRSKSALKDLLKDDARFSSLCQIDKCFVTRFLGERYKHERKFEDAVRLHTLYSNVARGLPAEEQRAFATLGSTLQDSAILGEVTPEEKLNALEKAELFTMKAVKAAKQLLSDSLNSNGNGSSVGRIEAGHMLSRGLFNLALLELSRDQPTSQTKAISCIEKALRVVKDYVLTVVGKQSSSATAGSEFDCFHLSLYEELAVLYRASHRLTDLWQLATDGIQLAEKLLTNAGDGRARVKARQKIAKFLMHKAHASLGECHFDIAARLGGEALKMLTSTSTGSKTAAFGGSKVKRRRVANEYAADIDDEDDGELDDEEGSAGSGDLSKDIANFKRTCCKMAKLSKKIVRLQKSTADNAIYSKLLEKIADLLFDEGIFQQAKIFYEKAMASIPNDVENVEKSLLGIIISIGRCLLALGGDDFDHFVSLKLKSPLPSTLRKKVTAGLYEIAVDHHADNSNFVPFTKYIRLEMDARRFENDDNENTLCRRFAEISKKIDETKGGDSQKQMRKALDDLLNELLIDKKDVSAVIAQLCDEKEDTEGQQSDLSSTSGLSSSDDEASSAGEDGENDGKPAGRGKQGNIFMPIKIKRNEKGETQLHVACRAANVNKAENLLKAGHPVNVCDGSGYFPLHDAADAGSAAIVALLMANGADANVVNELNGLTPAMEAASNGHLPNYRGVLRVLLARGNVNWDTKDNRARTAVHFLRENRSQHETLMSSEDLADWMELESLMLGKMRKKPSSSTSLPAKVSATQQTQRQRVSNCSADAHRRRAESSSFSSNDEDIGILPPKSKEDNDDAVHLYQSVMGGVSRSAKSGKRKVVENDGTDDTDIRKASTKKKDRPNALNALVANNPFLDENEIANEDAGWLVDDVGGTTKRRTVKTATSTKKQQAKRDQAMSALENVAQAQAQFGNDDQLVAAVLAASARDNENLDGQLLLSLFGDDVEDDSCQKRPSLPRNNSNSMSQSSSKSDRNDFVGFMEDDLPVINAPFVPSLPPQRQTSQASTSFNSNRKVVVVDNAGNNSDFLTIRVHLERDDPSAVGGRRRDSLLINNIVDSDGQWDIKRLRHETKVRYAALFGQSPVISSMRLLDGTTLADDSRLAPIASQHGELLAIIDRWDLPPLVDRYTAAASLLLPTSSCNPDLTLALTQAEQSGRLDIRDLLLSNCQLHCVFKALMYQTNVSSLCLSGNRFGSGSPAGSSSLLATSKAFADMLATLPNLVELDLSLANISGGDLEQISQALAQSSNNKNRLRRLNLCYNSLCSNASPQTYNRIVGNNYGVAESLATLLRFFSPSLRRLSLASCELDGESLLGASHDRLVITEAFQSLRELNEIDLSHNRRLTSSGGLEYLLTQDILLDQLTVLRLNGLFPSSAANNQHSFGRVIVHILNNCNRLVELSLSSNSGALDDDQVIDLANSLERARCLTALDLSANAKLTSRAFLELARSLPRCRIVRLDLSSTSITSPLDLSIFDCLADKMDSPSPLIEFALSPETNFTSGDRTSLRQVLRSSVKTAISCSLQFC